jgi:hypothetical protein
VDLQKFKKFRFSLATIINLANPTDLIHMNFHVPYGSTLDDLWRDCDGALYKNDTLILQACDPFDHLFADFPLCYTNEGLDGICPLAQVEKTHLASLCTRGLNTRTKEDRLAL